MSTLVYDIKSVGEGLAAWVRSGVRKAMRTTAGPTLIRVIAAAAAAVGLWLALPEFIASSSYVGLLVPLAAGVGLFPRTRWVSLMIVGTVVTWLVTTIAFTETGDPALWQVGALAAALYTSHAAATLAAALPYDCVVSPGVLARWAGRTALVAGFSISAGLVFMAALGGLAPVKTIVGPIVGSGIAAGLAGLLAWHVRRRR